MNRHLSKTILLEKQSLLDSSLLDIIGDESQEDLSSSSEPSSILSGMCFFFLESIYSCGVRIQSNKLAHT
jgi:hypothetical protein